MCLKNVEEVHFFKNIYWINFYPDQLIYHFSLHYTGASFFVICLHATFYNFDALDLMDDQQELTGSIVEEVWSCKKKKEKKINILSF